LLALNAFRYDGMISEYERSLEFWAK